MKERRQAIQKFIEEKGEVSIALLSEHFSSWSEMTIRRDLELLEKERVIIRTKGGARMMPGNYGVSEDLYSERESRNYTQKQEIAEKAAHLVDPNSGIFIDSGTTMMAFARALPDCRIAIITSGPNIALEIANRKQNPSVILLGGTLNRQTMSISGFNVLEQLSDLNIDTAFMVSSGFSEASGFSVGNQHECELKRQVIARARRVVMLMDSSKVGTILPFTFAKPEDIDILIADSDLPKKMLDYLKRCKVELL